MAIDGPARPGLVGRDVEMAMLARAFTAAQNGEPRVVMLEAEPGLGKTALLREAARFAVAVAGTIIVQVTCDEFEATTDYSLVEVLLRSSAKPPASSVAAGRRLLEWLGQLQGDSGMVVICIDDVQWMDPSSVEALRFAARRLGADRVLVVLARRPPRGLDPWSSLLTDRRLATSVTPATLNAEDVSTWTERLHGATLSPPAAERLIEHTGGIPLLLGAFLLSPSLPDALPSRGPLPVPATAGSAVLRMLGSPDDQQQLLIDALAVLNEPTDRLTLGRLLDLREPDHCLSTLLVTGVVVLDRESDTVAFAHALYRDVVYDRMDLTRCRALHRWAALETKGDRSLAHQVAAAVRPDGELCASLVTAAQHARDNGLPALAAAHSLRARRVAMEPGIRDELLLEAVHDRLTSDDLTGALELRSEAESTGRGPLRALTLGTIAHRDGRVHDAQRHLRDAIQLSAEAIRLSDDANEPHRIEPVERSKLLDYLTRSAAELGELYAALNEGERVLDAVSHLEPTDPSAPTRTVSPSALLDERSARVLSLKAVGLWEVGRLPDAVAVLADVKPTGTGARWEPDLFAVRGMIGYSGGDLHGSAADLDHALSLVSQWGPSMMRDRAHTLRALTRFMLGDWDAANVDASTACTLAHSADRPWMIPLAHAVAALVPAHRGEWENAEKHLRLAREGQARLPSAQGAALIASASAHLATERGDFAAVRDALLPMWTSETFDRMALIRSYRWVLIALGEATIRLGDLDAAEAMLKDYARQVAALPQAPGSARLGWLRGQLAEARGRPQAAQRAYADDLAEPHVENALFGHARLLLSSGRLERALGRRQVAIRQLSRAREILAGLRAHPRLSEVDSELAACGLRAIASDPLQLTEREQDVAALVGKGMTNNEIAAELFVTSKTVEYHLRNIFMKLGISNRRELRRRLTA